MLKNQFSLFTKRRFLPLFITQFFGAFNDNLFKNALVVLITYYLAKTLPVQTEILVTLSGCLLILPMFLFSAQAGAIADKFEKAKLIRIIKVAEIILMIFGGIGFILQNVTLIMIVLFGLGVQATFFGPLKYSILPVHLHEDELVAGNGLIEMGTFLAILLGNISGAVFITQSSSLSMGMIVIAFTIILIATMGYLSSCFIPHAKAAAPQLKLSLNLVKETWNIINFSRKSTTIFLCILGISWFWLIGFTFLAVFPNYTKDFIGGSENVFVLFITIFSIGIGIGSSLCNRLLKGRIEASYVPIAALGMSIFTFDLFLATRLEGPVANHLLSIKEFIGSINHWRIMIDMLLIAITGGIYIVPLYAIMQHTAQDSHKARVIASNNIMNALFMTVAAIVTMVMFELNMTIPQVFLSIAIINLIAVVQSCRLLPGELLKSILRIILTMLYRVEVKGIEHYYQAGNKVVITPNHTSFLDGLLLAAFLPGKLSFAMYSRYTKHWWVKIINHIVPIFGLDPTNPYVMKAIVKYVKEDKRLVIFPEGRITVTGALMKIYEGPGMIADKAQACILPILIEGAQYSPFSRLRGMVHLRAFPKITLTIHAPVQIKTHENVSARRRRQLVGQQLYEIMSHILFLGTHLDTTLFQSLIEAKKIHGGDHIIAEDIQREPLSYKRLILGAVLLGRKLAKLTERGEFVGILMPNVLATIVTFFGLQAYLRVAALLNFSTGTQNVVSAALTAKLKLVCTSRKFIETAKLQSMVQALEEIGIKICYLEDIKISTINKIMALMATCFLGLFGLRHKPTHAVLPAVVLFTSGSEGKPKAVVLSHRNLHANKGQLSSRVDFTPIDVVLNALPMFHSFGLTAGTLLPILYGMKVFFYPSPLHYRVIPELSYDINATILFGTNTFLAGYARYAHPYDFYSIRYVYAGAEKLKEENRRLWADKFGVRIFEGYGATETSPVISANTPMHNRPGTVGKLMPGIDYQLDTVPDIANGGRLIVKGPNIMLGYMFSDNPGVLVPPLEGWYDTGDIVSFDEEGYITIQGRVKRFAKIGGEMVSLTFVEQYLDKLWPQHMHAVVTQPDEKKGEQLVLFTTNMSAQKSDIAQYVRSVGISELAIPKVIHTLSKLLLLGTGKIDYIGIQALLKDIENDS
ncbi:MAG: acyl-[ACP]--phospholipid O-acyltransferase [Proteobacteria bacterium]|nr:acyl-[ACP]--phospholipid O-acyltransferase [Pseudomonadota bacterium]